MKFNVIILWPKDQKDQLENVVLVVNNSTLVDMDLQMSLIDTCYKAEMGVFNIRTEHPKRLLRCVEAARLSRK